MPPLKTIALHIGPHKTGTSYVQSQIGHHQRGLEAAGWAVLGGPTAGVDLPPNASFFLRCLLNHEDPGFAMPPVLQGLDAPELLRTFLAAHNAPHLLISAEDMSMMTRAHWQAFRQHLLPFMDEHTVIRVLMFVRHPTDWAASFRNQVTKNRHSIWPLSSFANFLDGGLGAAERVVDVWGESVKVEVHRFEDAKKEGIWPFFLQRLGLNPQDFPDAKAGRENASLPAESRLIFEHFNAGLVWPDQNRIFLLEGGVKDGCTGEEAREIWGEFGERLNDWLAARGLPVYAEMPRRLDWASPDLWSEVYVNAWKQCWPNLTPESQNGFLNAFAQLQSKSAAWHPRAQKRFKALQAWLAAGGVPVTRASKWRTAGRLFAAVLEDAWTGRRKWPATRRALPKHVQQRQPAPAPRKQPVLKPPKNWMVPPRETWRSDPFAADRFPHLRLLSFHMPKTAGTAFARSLEASALGEGVCFLSNLVFGGLEQAVQAFPEEDRTLAFANAIAAGLPADATVIHGHVLFHELLLPTLPFDRPEVLKVIWLRAPEHHVYSRYAFIQQVLMRNAPENWRQPEFAEGVFRDILDGCNQPHFRNGQSRSLSGMKLESFDFVGITEFFEQDLAQISALLQVDLHPLKANASQKPRPLKPHEIEAIRAYHDQDVALYERALALRENR